jgi:hypothetical protein
MRAVSAALRPRWNWLRTPSLAHARNQSGLRTTPASGTNVCTSRMLQGGGNTCTLAPSGRSTRASSANASDGLRTCSKTWSDTIASNSSSP